MKMQGATAALAMLAVALSVTQLAILALALTGHPMSADLGYASRALLAAFVSAAAVSHVLAQRSNGGG